MMDDDGYRPHRMPKGAGGEELLAWKCAACGHWVDEFSGTTDDDCPVDWRREK